MNKCLILANGKAPQKSVVRYLQNRGYNTLICADGGANSAKKLGLTPNFIVGDLDSINPETLKYYKGKSEIIKLERQTDTDVEKCLKFALSKGYKEAVLTGVTGDRLDHTFCNLGIILKYYKKIYLRIIAETSILSPYSGTVEIPAIPGELISLYSFDLTTKISSSGLKYPLKNTMLPFGKRDGTSNIAVGNTVKLKISNGIIFVIRNFGVSKKVIIT